MDKRTDNNKSSQTAGEPGIRENTINEIVLGENVR